jgi:hypothetical protein
MSRRAQKQNTNLLDRSPSDGLYAAAYILPKLHSTRFPYRLNSADFVIVVAARQARRGCHRDIGSGAAAMEGGAIRAPEVHLS